MRLSSVHQMKFVVNPPSNTTQSFGSPVQITVVPAILEVSPMGLPAVSAKAKQALMIPENVATRMPLVKLNSAMARFFSASGISRSLVKPAQAAIKMPSKQTATPTKVTCPDADCAMATMLAFPMGSASVVAAGITDADDDSDEADHIDDVDDVDDASGYTTNTNA